MLLPKLSRQRVQWFVIMLALLVGAVVWLVVRFLSPTPPSKVVLSSGDVNGAYHAAASKYQATLAQHGVQLEVRPSAGSVENLARLESQEVDIAFVQGGLDKHTDSAGQDPADAALRAIAVVGYEPVWIFSRTDLNAGLQLLRGKRVIVGAEGSGARKVALEVLGVFGLQGPDFTGMNSGGMDAAEDLIERRADTVILVAAANSPVVQRLLNAPSIVLASPAQMLGVARKLPYLQSVVLPRGSVDAAADLPKTDITLLTTTANLVVRTILHPAVQSLLLDAAQPVHRMATLVSAQGEFPRAAGADFLLSDEAQRYFKDGQPFLQRYLPYWLANFVQRLILIAIPLFAILVPLLKTLPELLALRSRSRLFRRYEELMDIEREIRAKQLNLQEIERDRQRLNDIERDISQTKFPLEFADRIYTLRQHIDFVRLQLQQEEKTAANAQSASVH
jgi:TRAP-type uncharacterized transport system substrate-binding protein